MYILADPNYKINNLPRKTFGTTFLSLLERETLSVWFQDVFIKIDLHFVLPLF